MNRVRGSDGGTTAEERSARRRSLVLLSLVFLVLTSIRTHGISTDFWLLGDQIRDWRIALGSVRDLPLVGAPSAAGGTTLGPIYYWYLWLVRVTVGPLVDNLPHAGGIGISLLQSAADVVLLWALQRRLRSWHLALAIVLFAATSPFDMDLSATIWNPPVAVAFAKLSTAVVLLRRPGGPAWQGALAVTLAWLSVQAHSPAIFVAAPVIAWIVVAPFVERRDVRATTRVLRSTVEVILLLQTPYLVHRLTTRTSSEMTTAFSDAISHALRDPGSLRLGASAEALRSATASLLFVRPDLPYVGWLLLFAAIVSVVRFRRDGAVLVGAVAPLACALAIGSMWRGNAFENYWYLSVMPAAACTLGVGLCSTGRSRWGRWSSIVALALVVAWIPNRARTAWSTGSMPEYGRLVRASRLILKRAPEVRAVNMPGLHPTTNPAFVYEILGGRISPSARFAATIAPDGEVSFEAVP